MEIPNLLDVLEARKTISPYMTRTPLCSYAGINKIAPFSDINPGDFDRIYKVNVLAPFLLSQAAIPYMKRKGWGRIVTISSSSH